MKKLVVSLLLALAGWTAFGQQIPSVSLQDGAGRVVTTASLIDHKTPFVVSIWMTTCKPCLKELDTLSEEMPDWDGGFPLRIFLGRLLPAPHLCRVHGRQPFSPARCRDGAGT